MSLKTLEYDGFSRYSGGVIVYWVSEVACVYSGITSCAHSTSTINAAEQIITRLLIRQRILSHGVKFYDLQTCHGYPQIGVGQFNYDAVAYRWSGCITEVEWNPTPCPTAIQRLFKRWIGPQPSQLNIPFFVL